MAKESFDFSKRLSENRLPLFVEVLEDLQHRIGFKVSSRGWCYLMEQAGHINKSQFDKVEDAINRSRKLGLLPVDFVAEETARAFSGIVKPSSGTEADTLKWMLSDVLEGEKYYIPDYWNGEDYYIQVVVEKTDLLTLFKPVCEEYNIPIANSKGWSSILQRAEYARRFKEAEDAGLQCVLLYGGDFDPDGLRISDTLRNNLFQIQDVVWGDGTYGYEAHNLEIKRFCLQYDFIRAKKYTWIDNLITGGNKNLASPKHHNFTMPYVQDYLRQFGERKCEANVLVTTPVEARQLMRTTIEEYLGADARTRYQAKRDTVKKNYSNLLRESGLSKPIEKFLSQ